MELLDIVARPERPVPWAEGEKIPWDDPAFSERMLREHLSQSHDWASRRGEIIDAHVRWIHGELLGGRATRVLDLGCGPGLYTSRLAELGHGCVGVDFSPVAIAYATDQAQRQGLDCAYRDVDVRDAAFGSGYGLVMMVFGEFNVFRQEEAEAILANAYGALDVGGVLLLEPHTFAAVERIGRAGATWRSHREGLFSDGPHLCLEESFWDDDRKTATTRYFVIDAATGGVTRHAATMQAYTDEGYRAMLMRHGFVEVEFFESLPGAKDSFDGDLMAIVARKPG